MSNANRTTVTRRGALKLGGIAALIAGVASAAPPVAAVPETGVAASGDLAAECRRLHMEIQDWDARERAAYEALAITLTPEQIRLVGKLSDAMTDRLMTEMDWRLAEIARHLPGVAPSILLLNDHTVAESYDRPGRCCTTADGA